MEKYGPEWKLRIRTLFMQRTYVFDTFCVICHFVLAFVQCIFSSYSDLGSTFASIFGLLGFQYWVIFWVTYKCYLHGKLLRLHETHNTLQLPVFFFLFFCQPYPEYRGIRSKKIFNRPLNSQYNSVVCSYRKETFLVYSFSEQVPAKGNSL